MDKRIKLVAIDLDGTLLKNDKTISSYSIDVIKQCTKQNIHIVIATTRSLSFVKPIYQQLNLNTPIICGTGAEVWETANGPLWIRHTIPLHVAKAIATLGDGNGWFLSTTINDTRYWRKQPNQTAKTITSDIKIVETNLEAMQSEPTRILTDNRDAIEAINNLCDQQFSDLCRTEVFHSPDGIAESMVVVSVKADKGSALQLILDRLNIDREQVMTIGDNNNDVPMFKQSGLSVAMGNALGNIKQHADAITDTNEQDGVAKALEQYVRRDT